MPHWNSSPHPISDIRDWRQDNRIILRPDFQRREVWSKAARVMLMDSILKNIPMPKVFVKSIVEDQRTLRIVIDGQQRLKAIFDFLDDIFPLEEPYSGEYLGLKFSALPQHVRNGFLEYKIDLNEIKDASEEFIREVYSRVNKYNFKLTKQELRVADFPGAFLNLSGRLATKRFFETTKIFSVADRRRMGDVEYISELLVAQISGPSNKKDALDQYYQKYRIWDSEQAKLIEKQFDAILDDISHIFNNDKLPLSSTRFRQKADFYSLFLAIGELHRSELSLAEKQLVYLRRDLEFLDTYITPESCIEILSEYAVKCVSQANTVASRTWRKELLLTVLLGTYGCEKHPAAESNVRRLLGGNIQAIDNEFAKRCTVCGELLNDISEDNVTIDWPPGTSEWQLSNADLRHITCC